MERVFGKSFIFSVDSYEVWRNQKCVDENNTDGEIIGIPYDNSMYFAYIGLTNGVTYKPFKTSSSRSLLSRCEFLSSTIPS